MALLLLAASRSASLQGAAEMCDWMAEHGTDPQLLNISNAVYTSPTENQIYQAMPDVIACSPAPGAAPASSAAPRAKAAGKVSRYPNAVCICTPCWWLTQGSRGPAALLTPALRRCTSSCQQTNSSRWHVRGSLMQAQACWC